jgi:hypothetical protein
MAVAWDRGQELESRGGKTVGVGVWGRRPGTGVGGGGQEREQESGGVGQEPSEFRVRLQPVFLRGGFSQLGWLPGPCALWA